jgi:hypothetical protein
VANFFKKLAEVGKRNSAADAKKLQAAHDALVEAGAMCAYPATEALRVDDSFDARRQALAKAARALFIDPDKPYDTPYCYVRDVFDTDVVVDCGGEIYQIPYTLDADGNPTLGQPIEVDVAYIPSDESDDGALTERKIPQSARKKMSGGDFAGKGKSFPIAKPEDVRAALDSIGRAGADNYDHATLKANILRIAKRKGFAIPKSDQKESAAQELQGDFVALREGAVAVAQDGSALIKIIAPGWGSSGHYSPEVLKRDGPKVFTEGLQMFWNHQTAQEESQRPEGDLDDLASKLTANAEWKENGPDGPGLYAPVEVYPAFRESINSLAPDIGVSIRASGVAREGKAEGRTGPIIERIAQAKSIDYVTKPGAGGKILQLFEAARSRNQKTPQENTTMAEQHADTKLIERVSLLERQNADLVRANLLSEARTFIGTKLTDLAKALPVASQLRLAAELGKLDPPLKESRVDIAALETRIKEAVSSEATYIAAITGSGQVKGVGSAPTADDEKSIAESEKSLEASFLALGLSESGAKQAARGRQ